MKAVLRVLALLCLAPLTGTPAVEGPQVSAPAPVRNFSLPYFNAEGHRTLLIRGNEAHLTNPQRPEFIDMTLSIFTGDATNRVETVMLSSSATVDTTALTVEGTGPVRLVRDDIELSGESWHYDHAAKRILIRRQARIIFRAELGPLLK